MGGQQNPEALCDQCGEKPAEVQVRRVAGGKEEQLSLCRECAGEAGSDLSLGPQASDPLSVLFQSMEGTGSSALCPQCGISYERFKETGRVGCAACYETFEHELLTLFRRIHGSSRHRGGTPVRQGEAYEHASRIKRLQDELDRAVSSEDYEQAAELRDRLSELESDAVETREP